MIINVPYQHGPHEVRPQHISGIAYAPAEKKVMSVESAQQIPDARKYIVDLLSVADLDGDGFIDTINVRIVFPAVNQVRIESFRLAPNDARRIPPQTWSSALHTPGGAAQVQRLAIERAMRGFRSEVASIDPEWSFDWGCLLLNWGSGAVAAAATCQPAVVVGGPWAVLACLLILCGATAYNILATCFHGDALPDGAKLAICLHDDALPTEPAN